MRWTSSGTRVRLRSAPTTTGPTVMLGTKRPSITSTWSWSPPPASTRATSWPSAAKSAERIEGAIFTTLLLYHARRKRTAVKPSVPCRWGRQRRAPPAAGGRGGEGPRALGVPLGLGRAGRVDEPAARADHGRGRREDPPLAAGAGREVGRLAAPLHLGVAAEHPRGRARRGARRRPLGGSGARAPGPGRRAPRRSPSRAARPPRARARGAPARGRARARARGPPGAGSRGAAAGRAP